MQRWTDAEIGERLYGGYFGEESNMETSGYRAMVDDIKERLGVEDDPEYGTKEIFEDIANHGADSGFSGFIYTSESVEFFDSHEDAIMELAREDAENFGYDNVMQFVGSFNRADMANDMIGYKNLMAWYALETVARNETDE